MLGGTWRVVVFVLLPTLPVEADPTPRRVSIAEASRWFRSVSKLGPSDHFREYFDVAAVIARGLADATDLTEDDRFSFEIGEYRRIGGQLRAQAGDQIRLERRRWSARGRELLVRVRGRRYVRLLLERNKQGRVVCTDWLDLAHGLWESEWIRLRATAIRPSCRTKWSDVLRKSMRLDDSRPEDIVLSIPRTERSVLARHLAWRCVRDSPLFPYAEMDRVIHDLRAVVAKHRFAGMASRRLFRHGRWNDLLKAAELLTRRYGELGGVEFHRAMALHGLGRRDQALRSIRRAIAREPDRGFEIWLANIAIGRGDYFTAMQTIKDIAESGGWREVLTNARDMNREGDGLVDFYSSEMFRNWQRHWLRTRGRLRLR